MKLTARSHTRTRRRDRQRRRLKAQAMAEEYRRRRQQRHRLERLRAGSRDPGTRADTHEGEGGHTTAPKACGSADSAMYASQADGAVRYGEGRGRPGFGSQAFGSASAGESHRSNPRERPREGHETDQDGRREAA